jgi:hypothetical protein
MTLLKPNSNNSQHIPYEKYYIQSIHKKWKLISEQITGNPNPLLLITVDPSRPPNKNQPVGFLPTHSAEGCASIPQDYNRYTAV